VNGKQKLAPMSQPMGTGRALGENQFTAVVTCTGAAQEQQEARMVRIGVEKLKSWIKVQTRGASVRGTGRGAEAQGSGLGTIHGDRNGSGGTISSLLLEPPQEQQKGAKEYRK